MITEAMLLDKIRALISGYQRPAHPLYGKSDKEIASVIKHMVSRYLTESKQQILKETDIFNPNNKNHLRILKEEIQRAKQLMLEYNEESTWESMTDDQKESALLAVDDDLGPDIAEEYTDMPWLRIPDVITNRVDLRQYMKNPDRKSSMFIASLMRGINNRMKEDANAAKFVKAYLGKTLANRVEDLTGDQVKDLMNKLHDFQASLSKFVAPSSQDIDQSKINMGNIINQDRIDNPGFSRD